ncbi:hypothetical protein F511_39836 [Dorcoceras hygrometricum]|uniref:Uncharacterized protein n=1 Tax=Dorcoceras hygrometricum TaxID=472368 RepID=A0A2Z7B1W3_9LAMI|nr:hypothetical protein F511_39836 [Dorcoceras hygrometricum]
MRSAHVDHQQIVDSSNSAAHPKRTSVSEGAKGSPRTSFNPVGKDGVKRVLDANRREPERQFRGAMMLSVIFSGSPEAPKNAERKKFDHMSPLRPDRTPFPSTKK